MADSLQAKKRAKQNTKRRTISRDGKSEMKTQIKDLEEAIDKGDVDAASEHLRLVTKKLDKTASTTTMHKKTAARKKSRLTKRLNALKAKKG